MLILQPTKIILLNLIQIGFGCPSAWLADTITGSEIYIRYRYGTLRVYVDDEMVFNQQVGDTYSGVLDTKLMLKTLSVLFDNINVLDPTGHLILNRNLFE